jgi:hypothetical protein
MRQSLHCEMGPFVSAVALWFVTLPGVVAAQPALQNQWDFNEPGGVTAFAAVGQVHGQLTPGALLGDGVVTFTGATYPGSAVRFGGGIGAFGDRDFAIELRMRSTQITQFGVPIELLGNRTTIGAGSFFDIRGFVGGQIGVGLFGWNDAATVESTRSVFDGLWHTIRVERTGTLLSLFIDDILEATSTSWETVDVVPDDDLILGNQYVSSIFPTAPFVGEVDTLRVFTIPTPNSALLLALASTLAVRRRR